MKSRSWILVLVVALAALLWLLWPQPVSLDQIAGQRQDRVPGNAAGRAATQSSPPLGSPVNKVSPDAYSRDPSNRLELMRRAFEDKNVPIDFYGETVDQDGNPLPGVHVTLRVRHWDITNLGASIIVERDSDGSGRFDVHDVTGDAFDLEGMRKSGYELEPMRRGFGPRGGTVSAPMIFKLWRKDIKEPLITGGKSFEILPDGRKYFVDITNGVISEIGSGAADISVWVKRPSKVALGERFDWSGGLQVLNGGGMSEETLDTAMYVAPTDGYSNLFEFGESASHDGWGGGFGSRRFYLSLNGGHEVGKMTISLYAYYNRKTPALIHIEYAINPTGSRILR